MTIALPVVMDLPISAGLIWAGFGGSAVGVKGCDVVMGSGDGVSAWVSTGAVVPVAMGVLVSMAV